MIARGFLCASVLIQTLFLFQNFDWIFSIKTELTYTKQFHTMCDKYSIIQQYVNHNTKLSASLKVIVFQLDNPDPIVQIGGLGDRMAGLLSAFAFALRHFQTRKLIIMCDDEGLRKAFRPYKNAVDVVPHNSNLSAKYGGNILDLTYCINPEDHIKRGDEFSNKSAMCFLDYADPHQPVILLQLNRCYMCQWVSNPLLSAHSEMLAIGISNTSDLYEFSGCLLRLLFWPTKLLWNDVDTLLASSSNSHQKESVVLASVHYRCGDASFSHDGVNTQCIELKGRRWQRGQESPNTVATCARNLLYWYQNLNRSNVIFISSDSEDSAKQIRTTLQRARLSHLISPPSTCHIDLNRNNSLCTYNTALNWFIFGISDHIITHSLTYKGFKYAAPHSAFSRFASMYALDPDALRLGGPCAAVDRMVASYQHFGNWWCHPPDWIPM